ncbi:glycerophosphodiester phosphodiesterase [Frankia sp. Cr1]|uniref:glycerophosphodiester phosphodiesterase n=1 Tax=Frankia sp. Cr1 TaxID=3073931 RepID=UPI002AD48B99|nr:glycerophosphodiester phosphodiesterase [Frankia sp. Cr1]
MGFAHRGAPAVFQRENTLAAFHRALTGGARGLESDVWLTADGVPVLHHDGVFGPPGRRRRISQTPAARLPRWLPRLADLYAACGNDFELSLDLKDPPAATGRAARAVVKSARAVNAAGRLWLCGNLDAIRVWRPIIELDNRGDPDATVMLVNSASIREIRTYQDARPSAAVPAALEVYTRGAITAGATVLNLRANDWSAAMVRLVHARGLLAFGWHAQSSRTLKRLLGFGLDGVYSDHLGRLVHATDSETTITRTHHVQ